MNTLLTFCPAKYACTVDGSLHLPFSSMRAETNPRGGSTTTWVGFFIDFF